MTIFFISDTHFGHKNIIGFRVGEANEGYLRINPDTKAPFTSVEEMDELMVQRWNSVVKPQDKVYHLGDFAFGKNPSIASRLQGHKRLVRGNHDLFRLKEYAKNFEEIYGVRHLKGCALTHVPIHPDCLTRWGLNIHGHLHANKVQKDIVVDSGIGPILDSAPDARYFCVSVEQINYTPISAEEIMQRTGKTFL